MFFIYVKKDKYVTITCLIMNYDFKNNFVLLRFHLYHLLKFLFSSYRKPNNLLVIFGFNKVKGENFWRHNWICLSLHLVKNQYWQILLFAYLFIFHYSQDHKVSLKGIKNSGTTIILFISILFLHCWILLRYTIPLHRRNLGYMNIT